MVLVVDNLNGVIVVGWMIKVDYVDDYKMKNEDDANAREWKCACGFENFKFWEVCFKCGVFWLVVKSVVEEELERFIVVDGGCEICVEDSWDVVDAAGFRNVDAEDEDAWIICEFMECKVVVIVCVEVVVKGLIIFGDEKDEKRDRKWYKKEKKEKKECRRECSRSRD